MAGRGQAQNLVPRCAHFVQNSHLPSTLTYIQVEYREPESKQKTRSKRAGKCLSEKPESASRSELSVDPRGRAGCVRVCVYVVFAGGWRVFTDVLGGFGVSAQFRVGHSWERVPTAWAEIWLRPCAPEPASPAARETRTDRHPGSGAFERRPGGVWLHVGLESAQAWRLRGAGLSAAAGFCCARRPDGSSREPQPSARLARGRAKRVRRREQRPRWPERRAERARGERPCPAPGALSAFLARLSRSRLPPPGSLALPPPSIPG